MTAPAWIEAGRGDSALVCLHGVSSSAGIWRPLLPMLAAQGASRAGLGHAGYGASAMPIRFDFAALADALAALLDEGRAGAATIVGHSLGGMVAMEFASRYPQRVAAWCSPAPPPERRASRGGARAFLARRLGRLAQGGTMAELADAILGDARPAPAHGAAGRASPAHGGDRAAGPSRGDQCPVDFDRRAALAGFDFPVLCIAGDSDRIATVPTMRHMATRIRGASLAVMREAGHLAPLRMRGVRRTAGGVSRSALEDGRDERPRLQAWSG